MYRVTKHGKKRIRERQNITSYPALLQVVKKKGKSIYYFKGIFFKYLRFKSKNYKNIIKVYGSNIFIFTRSSKKLITTYPVPEKYIPIKDYEIGKGVFVKVSTLNNLDGNLVCLEMKSGEIYKGIVVANLKEERTFIKLNVDGKIIKIMGSDIRKIISKNLMVV